MKSFQWRTLPVLAAAMICSMAAHAADPCPGTAIAGGYPLFTPTVSGPVLCETTRVFGQPDLAYTVKYQRSSWPFDVVTYNKVINGANFGPLRLRAVRRVMGDSSDATDLFKAHDTARPVLVWVHGGGFTSGDRNELQAYAKPFADRGFVNVMPDYAVVPQQDFATKVFGIEANKGTTLTVSNVSQEAQRNIQTAIRHLRASAAVLGISTSKIYVVGVSAGAITALRLATRPQDVGSPGSVATRDIDVSVPSSPREAAPGQGTQPAHIGGAVSISGMECFPGMPAQITISGITMKMGDCAPSVNAPNGAKFGMLHGRSDGSLPYSLPTGTCAAYGAQCLALVGYDPYPANEVGNGVYHADGSVGPCNAHGPSVWGGGIAPGGDHFISDAYWCQSRTGITAQGELAPGLMANADNDKATIAVQIEKALVAFGVYRD